MLPTDIQKKSNQVFGFLFFLLDGFSTDKKISRAKNLVPFSRTSISCCTKEKTFITFQLSLTHTHTHAHTHTRTQTRTHTHTRTKQLFSFSLSGDWINLLYQLHPLLNILTSIWVLRTPNAGQNMLFHIFSMKNIKQQKKAKNQEKACFWSFFQKLVEDYLYLKTCFSLNQYLDASPKNTFLPYFVSFFFYFLSFSFEICKKSIF